MGVGEDVSVWVRSMNVWNVWECSADNIVTTCLYIELSWKGAMNNEWFSDECQIFSLYFGINFNNEKTFPIKF